MVKIDDIYGHIFEKVFISSTSDGEKIQINHNTKKKHIHKNI